MTTEDTIQHEDPPPGQISLTDCLACSGCVTSAEAVLVSLQSHMEVLNTLDAHPEISLNVNSDGVIVGTDGPPDGMIFVASISPQVRAGLAATFDISERKASRLIDRLLRGPDGLRNGGLNGSGFTWVVDTDIMREAVLSLTADEVMKTRDPSVTSNPASDSYEIPPLPARPVLSSACPGWICYAEKSKPFTIPHISRLKSPQALTGTYLKTVLSRILGISPSQIWHLAVMPCFDKKLEASREELTDVSWQQQQQHSNNTSPVRDVDCVITTRELLTLASSRGISLPDLSSKAVAPEPYALRIPDRTLNSFVFSNPRPMRQRQTAASGTSGGYLHHVLVAAQARNPGSEIVVKPGRHDVVQYELVPPTVGDEKRSPILTAARYYGFKNIQNLVRKLEPKRMPKLAKPLPSQQQKSSLTRRQPMSQMGATGADYDYVEVMACPGGCTNGGGQIRVEDLQSGTLENGFSTYKPSSEERRAWLRKVDEAYFSAESDSDVEDDDEIRVSQPSILEMENEIYHNLLHWSQVVGVPLSKLVYTTYRKVESDVGKVNGKANDTASVVELAGRIGGGW